MNLFFSNCCAVLYCLTCTNILGVYSSIWKTYQNHKSAPREMLPGRGARINPQERVKVKVSDLTVV